MTFGHDWLPGSSRVGKNIFVKSAIMAILGDLIAETATRFFEFTFSENLPTFLNAVDSDSALSTEKSEKLQDLLAEFVRSKTRLYLECLANWSQFFRLELRTSPQRLHM